MLRAIPLLAIVVIAYNIAVFAAPESMAGVLTTIALISGASWTVDTGDAIIIFALVLLYIEILKSTTTTDVSIADHALSMVVFVVCLIEFLIYAPCGTSVFFIIMMMTALDVIAGYSIMNDVSEREYQMERDGQWLKGKSFDTFAPLGPWLVTPDEVADPQNLNLWLELNGERMQDGTTADMIFGISHLISSISQYMTLMPGDVIPTGTPTGVGFGRDPQVFLKPGDVMRLGIEGLGEQRQEVKAWEDVH